ncbi:MAG: hypothetical protein ABIU76_14480 [Gemmatimonadaceae bacterium]
MMAVFAGHLGLVSSGAVCVRPGMSTMSAAVATAPSGGDAGSMRDMPGMREGVDAPPAEQGPCSGPATGQCLASMACVTVLGSDAIATQLPVLATRAGDDASWTALMPASSSTAPELPPPRA